MLLPIWFGGSVAFIYGIIVGSFLNVCIYRFPEEQSVVSPPSHCPKCNTKLKGMDLVPLFSFLLLGRKCRYCRTPISWRYFTIELITGLMFVWTYLKFGYPAHLFVGLHVDPGYAIDFFAYVLFLSALIIAFVVDLDHWIIPDQVPIAGVIIGLGRDVAHLIAGDGQLVRIPLPFTDFRLPMLQSVVGLVVCGGLFYLIAFVSYYVFRPKEAEKLEEYEGAMGGGDVKLAAAIGAVVGMVPGLVSFMIAVFLGTIAGVAFILVKARSEKKGVPWRTEIPFGPYMVAGSLAVIMWYPQIEQAWKMWVRFITPG